MKQMTIEKVVVTFLIGVLGLSSTANVFASASQEDVKMGVYYYIWWGIPFNNHWEHGVKYTPFLGRYNSSDPLTADKHILWAKQHGIDFFAVSWLGEGKWIDWINWTEDHTWDFDEIDHNLRNITLNAPHLQNFNFCLFYETEIVIRTANQRPDKNFTEIFTDDIVYAAENYFINPSYLRVNGRPVLFLYNLPYLYANLTTSRAQGLLNSTRELSENMGVNIYFVGDVGPGPSPKDVNSDWLYSMDAVTSYFFSHHLISEGWQNIMKYAETYYPQWRLAMNSKGIRFIPNAYPGFDNTEYVIWLNRTYGLNRTSLDSVLPLNETMFKKMLTTALNYADKDLKIVMVTSWNEWLESTAIEPSMEFGELFLHAVLDAKTTQSCPDAWNVVYFAVGAGSGVIVTIIFFYIKSFRKRKRNWRLP